MGILPQCSSTVHPAPGNANPNPKEEPGSIFCIFFLIFFLCSLCFYGVYGHFFITPKEIKGPVIRLNSLSLSNFSVSSSIVSGNWTASFTVVNREKKWEVSHTGLTFLVYYQNVIVAIAGQIPPLVQDTSSAANVTAEFLALSPFLEEPVLDRSRDKLRFDVEVHTKAHFKARGWNQNVRYGYVAYCPDLSVDISSNYSTGEFIHGPVDCRVTEMDEFWHD